MTGNKKPHLIGVFVCKETYESFGSLSPRANLHAFLGISTLACIFGYSLSLFSSVDQGGQTTERYSKSRAYTRRLPTNLNLSVLNVVHINLLVNYFLINLTKRFIS